MKCIEKDIFCITFLVDSIKVCYSSGNVYLGAWFVPFLRPAGTCQGERDRGVAHAAVMRRLVKECNNVVAHSFTSSTRTFMSLQCRLNSVKGHLQ